MTRFRPNGHTLHRLTLICDACGSEFARAIVADSPTEASIKIREEASASGWTFPGSNDICAECNR